MTAILLTHWDGKAFGSVVWLFGSEVRVRLRSVEPPAIPGRFNRLTAVTTLFLSFLKSGGRRIVLKFYQRTVFQLFDNLIDHW